MINLLRFPSFILAFSFSTLWLSARFGALFCRRRWKLEESQLEDLALITAATLTLLSLIIGFTFSMAINRYDLRKNYEEQEANAIGTEYVRADFLSVPDAARVRDLLRRYLDQRVLFYRTRDDRQLQQINSCTVQLQAELWSAVQAPGVARPTPVVALAVSGANDVLNSQVYAQAASWNRIPVSAWGLMVVIAMCGNLLLGYGLRRVESKSLLLVLPLIVSMSFFLIADIDSPRLGLIRVRPENLLSVAQTLHGH